jgi:hypothetical protein
VGEFAGQWLAERSTSSRRLGAVCRRPRHPRDRALGRSAADKVEHGEVQSWLAELSDSGLSAASVRKAHGVISGILGLAVKDRGWPAIRRSGWRCRRWIPDDATTSPPT